MNWLQVLIAWLVWGSAAAQIPAGAEVDSPPFQITLGSGKVLLINFHAKALT